MVGANCKQSRMRRGEGGAARGMGSVGTTPKAAQNLHTNELQGSVRHYIQRTLGRCCTMPCNTSTHHLHMLGRQHLRAAVDEPSHIGWVIRHAHANVIFF